MLSKTILAALALAASVSASPSLRNRSSDPCQDAYKACIAAGTPEVACSCTLTACVGEDNARNREYCASATANLPKHTSTAIPGGCNPAHPGSCPASSSKAAAAPSSTSIPGGCNPAHPGSCPTSTAIPGGCNPAHPGSCPTPSSKAAASPSSTAIPGGCNPAHPGSCPTTLSSKVSPPASTAAAPKSTGTAAPGSNPKKVEGKKWSIKDLTRYCGEGNTGCDYNFSIEANGQTQRCTVIRMPGSNAATESWSNQPCTTGSDLTVSWGYVQNPAPAYAVITVNDYKTGELAWFGASNINGQKVTPSNPFGSGQFGNLGPEQVYTYN